MAFWSNANAEPTRKYRFKIFNDKDSANGFESSSGWFWASTVTKPSFTLSEASYQIINHVFKYPGVPTWDDVTIQVVDTGKVTHAILKMFKNQGYDIPSANQTGIKKPSDSNFKIYQLDAAGASVEEWTLFNSFIKSISFGELSYADDDLVSMEIIVGYDYADLGGVTGAGTTPTASTSEEATPSNAEAPAPSANLSATEPVERESMSPQQKPDGSMCPDGQWWNPDAQACKDPF